MFGLNILVEKNSRKKSWFSPQIIILKSGSNIKNNQKKTKNLEEVWSAKW
jgi:hypothetical protein